MAASDAAIIDVESDAQRVAEAQLQFQDFGENADERVKMSKDPSFTSFPDPAAADDDDDDDTERSIMLGEEKATKDAASFWSFEYYQKFFNVDTNEVLRRLLWSMIPRPHTSYLQYFIRPNPDLYGPFWVCTTLIFTTAIMGNLANYLKIAANVQGEYVWQYDFHKVTLAATAIYVYASLVPLLLWSYLWYRRGEAVYTFLEIICVYGYSLSIYIPVSILWVLQINWLQWLLVIAGSVMSGTVLLLTFWPAVKNDQIKLGVAVMTVIMILHFLLAAGFLLYFFHVPDTETKAAMIVPLPATAIAPLPESTIAALTTTETKQLEALNQVASIGGVIVPMVNSTLLVSQSNITSVMG